ncbi:valine--tRNA ligase, partial [Candidatus Woesearchaeota archaeon]
MAYDFKEEEKKWQEFWKEQKIHIYHPIEGKEDYIIDTPPPTLSGRMHIGHASSYSQQDFIARYKRMSGKNVCYPFGTDDNGLPTERLVEKEKKVRSTKMDRQEFIALCNQTIQELKPSFIQDWISIGMSCDFEHSYSTIDPHCITTSQASFIDLFEKGLVFQEDSPISWCPTCQTAIAQAEFESVDKKSHFNDLIFTVGGKELVVATTRPELLPSCVAIFVHPDDERYTEFIGKHAKVPLYSFEVPILADEKADPQKGTGAVMCCTFGDQTDVEWWRKHNLPLKVSINRDGTMNDNAGKYAGLKIKDARKAIIEDLKEAGLLPLQKEIVHPVNTHERCGTDLEILKTKQWFVRVLDKKQELLDAGDRINWYPSHMKVRYKHWVENLNWDWCISRQRHFGVPFPVWYEKDTGKVIVASRDELPVDPLSSRPKHYTGTSELVPETDVMDTWATSSVTPQIITNWADKGGYDLTPDQFPTSMRPQAHDIIRTWAFYTIVKALYNNADIPWKDIVISGHVLDPKGNKMSKSKGNVVDPRIILEKYGADALRFWTASSKLGDDIPFQEKDVQTGKKTVTKLANASNFVLMHLEDYDGTHPEQILVMDKWLLSKAQKTIRAATESFEKYEYVRCKMETEKLFWTYFCDNYLEICKDRIYNPDRRGVEERKSAQYALSKTLLTILKLFAPIMPHITESVYQKAFAKQEGCVSIHVSNWPKVDENLIDLEAEHAGDAAIAIISAVRKFKSEQKVSLKTPVQTLSIHCDDLMQQHIESVMDDLKAVTGAQNVVFGNGEIDTGF